MVFYTIEKDEEGRLKYCFWLDVISRQDFDLFGEAVTFDKTYWTNYYKLVFAMFCDVNHQWKTTTFAGSFISNEDKFAFLWLFARFTECIGRAPLAIIIDQNPTITSAIVESLPNIIHRFCAWHGMHKISDKLGGIATKVETIE